MAEKTSDHEPPASLFWIVEDFIRLRSYFRTTQALRRGTPLHDWPQRELDDAGYLGPWTYNLYESSLAGLPAAWGSLLLPILTPQPSKLFGITDPLLIRIAPLVFGAIYSFYVPLLLSLMSVLGAWSIAGIGRKRAELRRRLIRIYLYEDGRLGWMPQAFLAIVSVFLQLWLCCGYAPADIDYTFPMFSGEQRSVLIFAGLFAYFATTLWLIPLRMIRGTGSACWFRYTDGILPKSVLMLRYQLAVGIAGSYLGLIGAAALFLLGGIASLALFKLLLPLSGGGG